MDALRPVLERYIEHPDARADLYASRPTLRPLFDFFNVRTAKGYSMVGAGCIPPGSSLMMFDSIPDARHGVIIAQDRVACSAIEHDVERGRLRCKLVSGDVVTVSMRNRVMFIRETDLLSREAIDALIERLHGSRAANPAA
jgi:hypothetical protein